MNIFFIIVISFILFLAFIAALLNKFLIKASSGQALVKTGLGIAKSKISLSSAIVVPLLNKVETIDLTVKVIRIKRTGTDSLSCADGIRAEVEVDFYVQINPIEEDIRRVATTIGCARASNANILRELFEAKFSDALKTAGSKLKFDELYQNRSLFRDEILKALGFSENTALVLNGYRLDDVAIQYLEQLPLEMHNENNVLDARGRKEIAQRTSAEAEAANKRLREKEITIAQQNQEARTKELQIKQDLAEKETMQEREIKEIKARQNSAAEQTLAEQERLATEALIAKEKAIKLAEERKEQEVRATAIEREKAIALAEQMKQQQIQLAAIQREVAEAEAQKAKLKIMEENARQTASKLKAEEEAETVRSLEIAGREKQIQVIQAQRDAEVKKQTANAEFDIQAYEIITVSKAKLEAADLDAKATELLSRAIIEKGKADAEAQKVRLEAENTRSQRVLISEALKDLVPLLPEIVEKLMKPAEKIQSVKVLNIQGMEHLAGLNGNAVRNENGDIVQSPQGNNFSQTLLSTIVNAGMLIPVMKEVTKTLGPDNDIIQALKEIPGGEKVIKYLEDNR